MNALQAFAASLARSRAQALADLRALDAAAEEHITIDPPVWCHACGRMLVASGHLSGTRLKALCADCAPRPATRADRRNPSEQRLRELVDVTRLLAWQAQDSAATYDDRGCHESARVLRELAAATNNAIEALRTNPQED